MANTGKDKRRLDHILGLRHPLFVAPMAGGPSSVEFVVACSKAGALGAMGAAYSKPEEIENFVSKVRQQTDRPLAINLFIPHPQPEISAAQFSKALKATEKFRNELKLPTPTLSPPFEEDFDAQFEMVLKLKPEVFSFVFGLLGSSYVKAAKDAGILLLGTATTLEEVLALQDSGVDAITLQGFEAGGHRGIFNAEADDPKVGLFDLLEISRGKIKIPVAAAGGLMTAQDVKTALGAGADFVQMGTAFLACEEAGTSKPYRRALLDSKIRKTKTTRAYSGRFARGIENRFMIEMEKTPDAILPFQAQNKFTRDIRAASAKWDSRDYLSLWSGTGEGELWTGPVKELIEKLFKP